MAQALEITRPRFRHATGVCSGRVRGQPRRQARQARQAQQPRLRSTPRAAPPRLALGLLLPPAFSTALANRIARSSKPWFAITSRTSPNRKARSPVVRYGRPLGDVDSGYPDTTGHGRKRSSGFSPPSATSHAPPSPSRQPLLPPPHRCRPPVSLLLDGYSGLLYPHPNMESLGFLQPPDHTRLHVRFRPFRSMARSTQYWTYWHRLTPMF